MRILTVLSTLAAAGLLVAGCGGDEGSSDEEFVAAVTEICSDFADGFTGIETSLADVKSEEDGVKVLEEEVIPLLEGLIDELEGVEAPGDKADDYDRLLEITQEQIGLFSEDPAAVFDPDSDLAKQSEELDDETTELARSLDVPEDCVEPGGGATGATGP